MITPYSDILSLSNKSRNRTILMFLCIAAIALPLSFLAASSAVKRIKALMLQMRRAVRGGMAPSSKHSSYGLKNINQRLKLHYGDEYGLTFASKLGVGTMVTITLPAVTHSE